jgi:hypothetical protein
MRIVIVITFIVLSFCNLRAQFSTDKLQVRFGYNVQNTSAGTFNRLIEAFNNNRYPTIISKNLGSVHFPMGFTFGANYVFREDIIFYGVFKSRRQFIEAKYANFPSYRQYLFRARTLEAGVMFPLRDDDRFSHYVGGGILMGVMEAHTAWSGNSGYNGARKMVSIDNSGIFGLSLSYEAQFRLHRNLRIFVRPVLQYAFNSPLRRLTDFFDPQVMADADPSANPQGVVTYGKGEPDKYDKGNFNGIGIEAGLLFLLPEF